MYDVIIVGASFAGLVLAGKLDKEQKVLIIERKENTNSVVETTGLITNRTKELLRNCGIDIENSILHGINSLGIVAPNFKDSFLSEVEENWIYTTNPNQIHKELISKLGQNVELRYMSEFKDAVKTSDGWEVNCNGNLIKTKVLVGADGAMSQVALKTKVVATNQKMLIGFEKIFPGEICKGRGHGKDIFHFWFGELALGYGGWISPDIIDGDHYVRVGFAIHKNRAWEQKKMDLFVDKLEAEGWIDIDRDNFDYFADLIPAGGVVKKVYSDQCLLIGDAAGMCGPFAADGIQGAVISGIAGAECINEFIKNGTESSFDSYLERIESKSGLISYYKKQLRYRFLWEFFLSSRSFSILYRICEERKTVFLENYCNSKDNKKSLTKSLFVPRNFSRLVKLGLSLIWDQRIRLKRK